jgi:hypothetical protein
LIKSFKSEDYISLAKKTLSEIASPITNRRQKGNRHSSLFFVSARVTTTLPVAQMLCCENQMNHLKKKFFAIKIA